jgi:hypothetical protein
MSNQRSFGFGGMAEEQKLIPMSDIQNAELSDFRLITEQISKITKNLYDRITSEKDPQKKKELSKLNREITLGIVYLRGETKTLSRKEDSVTKQARERVAKKEFDTLKANLIKAQNIDSQNIAESIPETKPVESESKEIETTPVTNDFINPNITFEPTFGNVILPTNSVDSNDQLIQSANPDIQTSPDLIPQPQNLDAGLIQSPEIKALQATVDRLQAEVASMKEQFEQYTNRPTYNNLLQADTFRQASPDWIDDQPDQVKKDKKDKKPDKIQGQDTITGQNNRMDADTQTASPETSNHEQSFDSAIDDVLHEFGQDKLPDDFIEEKDILIINSLNSTSKDLSPEEEDFLTRLRKYLNPKDVDQNADTQVRSNDLTRSPNYTVKSPFRTAVTPYNNADTQPMGQQTVQSNRVDDTLVTQKGYLMEIFNKKTQSLTRIRFEDMVANSPSIAQKHEQLVKASEDNTDMATFKNLLYGLMTEIVRIDSTALPQNITQQGPSYNTMPTPITPASV